MTSALLAVVVALVFFTVVGLCVVAPLRPAHRDLLLPGAPLLGVALTVAIGSSTAYVWPAAGAAVATLGVCAALAALALRAGHVRSLPSRAVLAVTALTWTVGAAAAAVALLPNVWAGTASVVSPTDGNDAFFYVAETSWLAGDPISPVPDLGLAPGDGNAAPADAPLRAALDFPLRIGQPLAQAVVSVLSGVDPVRATAALVAMWVALLVPATWVAARAARLRPGAALAVAVVTGTSALAVQAVYQQTFDGVLGAALAVLTLGLGLAVPGRRVPVWPGAVALAGLVSVYGEYLVLVVPAVVVGALAARPRLLRARLTRLLVAAAVAVVLAPTAWVRAATALQLRRDGDAFGSPLFSDGWLASLARATGVAALGAPVPGARYVLPVTVALVAVVVVGWLSAVLLTRHRAAWAALLVLDLGYVAYLTLEHRGYSQVRVATLVLPLVLLAAAAGWSALSARWVRACRGAGIPRVARAGATAVVVVVVMAVAAVNLRTAPSALDPQRAQGRVVDARYATAAGWVEELGGPQGRDVSALVPDLFVQMWLAHALRDSREVAYPSLRPDYLGTVSHWAGESDPLLLVGPGAVLDAPPQAVVREQDGLRLVDARRGDVVAAVPAEAPEWAPYAAADGRMYAVDGSSVLVLDPAAGQPGPVRLTLGGLVDGESVAVTVRETGEIVRTLVAGGSADLDLPTDGQSAVTVDVDLGADGTVGTAHFALEGVSRAP